VTAFSKKKKRASMGFQEAAEAPKHLTFLGSLGLTRKHRLCLPSSGPAALWIQGYSQPQLWAAPGFLGVKRWLLEGLLIHPALFTGCAFVAPQDLFPMFFLHYVYTSPMALNTQPITPRSPEPSTQETLNHICGIHQNVIWH
jgi:hypothetical protein